VAAKLVVIMVGLPARGKSYITKKIQRYLSWQQHNTEVFNVGNRRRVAAGHAPDPVPDDHVHDRALGNDSMLETDGFPKQILLNGDKMMDLGEPTMLDLNATEPLKEEHAKEDQHGEKGPMDQSAAFFDPKNQEATRLREQLALDTLDELLDYLILGGGAVGILDATNSTIERRKHLIDRIRDRESKLPILFIESVCDDKHVSSKKKKIFFFSFQGIALTCLQLLEANMRLKLAGPDYKDKDPAKSLEDFRKRVIAYESAYEPLGEHEEREDLQYIKMIDVGRKVVHYRLKGFLSTSIAGYLTTFNLSPRQIWITRHGQSEDNVLGKIGGNSPLTPRGRAFTEALYRFITYQRQAWLVEEQSKLATATLPPKPGDHTPPYPEWNMELDDKNFCVWTSMMRRCTETAALFEADDDYDVKYWDLLNELNAGALEGMTFEQIARQYPDEFRRRYEDKLSYVFPGVGGESYLNVINRLRDVVREMERISDHLLIIGHRSICRVLMAYFMNMTRQDIADIDVHLGMAYCIEPRPYGIAFHAYRYNEATGWFELQPKDFTVHKLHHHH
jgi:6-phosphofructo-2-kinase